MIKQIKRVLSTSKDVKAAADRMNETLEIREPVVRPIRERREERRRASMPTLQEEPVENGSHS